MNKECRIIYLVRHGHTIWNEERRYQGVVDQELSSKGRAQVKKLTERFRNVAVDHVFSSPSTRAVDTVRVMAKEKYLTLHIEENLREMDFGAWEGIREEDIIGACGGRQYYPDFLNEPKRWKAPGEQFLEAQSRIVNCVERILKEYPQGNLVIASHLNVLKLLFMKWFEMEDLDVIPRLMMDNTAVNAVQTERKIKRLITWNDTAHLNM